MGNVRDKKGEKLKSNMKFDKRQELFNKKGHFLSLNGFSITLNAVFQRNESNQRYWSKVSFLSVH